MAIRNTNNAEAWEKVYEAFDSINFTAFDYDTVKQSLIDYLTTYYPEHFNDFIESSEFIAFLGIFAYVAELLAYRIDINANENFMPTAQRQQTILKLVKTISYKVSRNIPARGLVKISSISTTEDLIDSQGNNLKNVVVNWNDANNSNWKEQFFLVLDRVMTGKIGQPQKSYEVDGVAFQLYSFNNDSGTFRNGVFSYTADTGLEQFPMEIVPVDIDSNGPFEKEPDLNSHLTLLYSTDGVGDSSDYTGFMMLTKQGTLSQISYNFATSIPNRTLDINLNNINEIDVWLQRVDTTTGNILEHWSAVDTVNEENVVFNTIASRLKYEVETLENNQIRLIFGAGDFADIPIGDFNIWVRQSANENVIIQKNKIVNQSMSFTYTSTIGRSEQVSLSFSAVSVIQNAAASETIDHIRSNAPATYYSQNRMVNGQDYNSFPLKDQSILKIQTVNRTFAGQPKYIDWHDASGSYENVKIFGDDLNLHYSLSINTINSTVSSRSLIDSVIEPILQSTNIQNLLTHISATTSDTFGVVSIPRNKFIEDNRKIYAYNGLENQPLLEKTIIQGALDQHWYGEAVEYVTINDVTHAKILDPVKYPQDDGKIYDEFIPRTIDGVNEYPPGDPGSGLQPIASQPKFGLKYNRTTGIIGNGTIANVSVILSNSSDEVFTLEFSSDKTTIFVTSNIRGSFASAVVGTQYSLTNSSAPIDFIIQNGTTTFENGDAFIVRTTANQVGAVDVSQISSFNLNGRWELIDGVTLTKQNGVDIDPNSLVFDPNSVNASWVIWVEALISQLSYAVIGYNIHFRELKLIAESENKHTKFWFNSSEQILDSETQNRVYDTIKILRSNLDPYGKALIKTENYDVVDAVKDNDGVVDIYSLEVIPSNTENSVSSPSAVPGNILQFEDFSKFCYRYYMLDATDDTEIEVTDSATISKIKNSFNVGAFSCIVGTTEYRRYPSRGNSYNISSGNSEELLDFMWQHFSPNTNMIDPSTSNIHDAYILTSGYYDNMMSYINGTSTDVPVAPTPLELRNSFGYIFDKKMMSDTVIMHPGKIRLLFGSLAEPQLRAKFKIVKMPTATLSDEKIKLTVINTINAYFNINNWDFGQKFYATDLTTAIHQNLSTEIATIVPVPVYSVNSFGSLFMIEPNEDEILQSCATVSDVEIVTELTPTVMRQKT
jgi:hypothetical protein